MSNWERDHGLEFGDDYVVYVFKDLICKIHSSGVIELDTSGLPVYSGQFKAHKESFAGAFAKHWLDLIKEAEELLEYHYPSNPRN